MLTPRMDPRRGTGSASSTSPLRRASIINELLRRRGKFRAAFKKQRCYDARDALLCVYSIVRPFESSLSW